MFFDELFAYFFHTSTVRLQTHSWRLSIIAAYYGLWIGLIVSLIFLFVRYIVQVYDVDRMVSGSNPDIKGKKNILQMYKCA